MNNPSLNLYSYPTSPFAAQVHCYLLYKNLPFHITYVNPLKIKQILPIGHQIPVLSVNNHHFAGSDAIMKKIDELCCAEEIATELNTTINQQEKWLTKHLTPSLFRFAFVACNHQIFDSLGNAFRLGHVMSKTCEIPFYISPFWPLILRQQKFIRDIVFSEHPRSWAYSRQNTLEKIDNQLKENSTTTSQLLTRADISAYALLAMPYYLGLKNADDFMDYPRIKDWMIRLDQLVITSNNTAQKENPPLVDPYLRKRPFLYQINNEI